MSGSSSVLRRIEKMKTGIFHQNLTNDLHEPFPNRGKNAEKSANYLSFFLWIFFQDKQTDKLKNKKTNGKYPHSAGLRTPSGPLPHKKTGTY